ncbi:MAG: hypothetical protein IPQ07_01395 [Myxococcales bacterium]|nr:hypothetical protein [Myxococcales bacterium]
MSRKPLLAAVAMFSLFAAGTAAADRRSFGASNSNYTSNGKFGLGIELGAPSGLNGKFFLSPNRALNFGVGWLYDQGNFNNRNYARNGGIHLYLDHLWHPVSLSDNPTFKLPLYIGVGGAFWTFDSGRDRINNNVSAIAVRVPFGIAFDFNKIPLDVFAQLTLVVDLFFGDYGSTYGHFGPGLEGSIGARFWF